MPIMLTSVLESLREDGIEVTLLDPPDGGPDLLVELFVDGVTRNLAVERRGRAPYPGEIAQLLDRRQSIGQWGTPTLAAPFIPDSTGRLLIPMGWSWADEQGNYDLALGRGLRLRRRNSSTPKRRPAVRRPLPRGSGGLAIIRFLLSASSDVRPRTGGLAQHFAITHARASQVLNQLREMGLATNEDGWVADRDGLLQRFLNEYRGPGGTEISLYSLDHPVGVLESLVKQLPERGINSSRLVVSADVGADLVAPWRRPTTLVVYVDEGVELDFGDMAHSDRSSANVFVRYPADGTVFGSHPVLAPLAGGDVRLADPVQMIWDLHDLGGEDRREAADHLSEWLLNRV